MSCHICGSPTKSSNKLEHLIGFSCGIGVESIDTSNTDTNQATDDTQKASTRTLSVQHAQHGTATSPIISDTNQASELFELCKEVYERTKWDNYCEYWSFGGEYTVHKDSMTSIEVQTAIIPLYNSDYLLEKLPEWIGKYGDMQMSRGYMKGGTGAFRFFYGRDGQEASIEGTGTTAVSALLKLTIALSEAGELNG